MTLLVLTPAAIWCLLSGRFLSLIAIVLLACLLGGA